MSIEGGTMADMVRELAARREVIRDDLKKEVADLWQDFTPDSYAKIIPNGVKFGWHDYAGSKLAARRRFRKNFNLFISSLDEPLARAARRLADF